MDQFRNLTDGEPRVATWAERLRATQLRDSGVADVYVEPAQAPPEFWNTVIQATYWHVAAEGSALFNTWSEEYRFAFGLGRFWCDGSYAYKYILGEGRMPIGINRSREANPKVAVSHRISAVEHMLDVGGAAKRFTDAVNERARNFRVGMRLEGARFVPVADEHIHTEVTQPVLMLLSDPRLAPVNELYRKAYDRIFADDNSGAITASTSAVEEMLRLGLNVSGQTLEPLARQAREMGWIIPAVEQSIVKLAALRAASDAHSAGTDSPGVATYALQQSAVVLRHLYDAVPSRRA